MYLRNTLNLWEKNQTTLETIHMNKSVKTKAPVYDYSQVYYVKTVALFEFRFIVYRI